MAALMYTVRDGNGRSAKSSVMWAAVGAMCACFVFLLATHPITGAPLSKSASAAAGLPQVPAGAYDPAVEDASLVETERVDEAALLAVQCAAMGWYDPAAGEPVDPLAQPVDPAAAQPGDPAAAQPGDPAAAGALRSVAGNPAAVQPAAPGPALSPAELVAQLAAEAAAAVEAVAAAAKAASAAAGELAEVQEQRAEQARQNERAAWAQPCPEDCHTAEGFATHCKRGRCMCVLGRGGPTCTFNLERLYFSRPIYSDLQASPEFRPKDMQGWSPDASLYEKYLEEVDAVTVVEIGVWKGLSAIHMASWLKKKGRGMLLAIDTWLGASEFLGDAQRMGQDGERELGLVHGWPTVYYSFLSNVVHMNVSEVVVPLAQTSVTATTVMFRFGLTADFIHIDGAHEYGPVRQDIRIWWPYVRSGGILMGDDIFWPGVAKAIKEFSAQCDLPFEVDGPKWVVRKPEQAWFDANQRLPSFCLGKDMDHLAGGFAV